eukprot:TRINITY_DN1642_c0_g5_i1.p1 TRINITY_DN1642_c0_g5~~TRINITY_DN1642_c0_g5_i1.p1  ORF type:complete len:1265 (+),score=434.12 TRINITY_DN1642_c0_g5_i1:248-4042(+)
MEKGGKENAKSSPRARPTERKKKIVQTPPSRAAPRATPRISAAPGFAGGGRKPGAGGGSPMRPRSAGATTGGYVRVGGISGRKIMASTSKDSMEEVSPSYDSPTTPMPDERDPASILSEKIESRSRGTHFSMEDDGIGLSVPIDEAFERSTTSSRMGDDSPPRVSAIGGFDGEDDDVDGVDMGVAGDGLKDSASSKDIEKRGFGDKEYGGSRESGKQHQPQQRVRFHPPRDSLGSVSWVETESVILDDDDAVEARLGLEEEEKRIASSSEEKKRRGSGADGGDASAHLGMGKGSSDMDLEAGTMWQGHEDKRVDTPVEMTKEDERDVKTFMKDLDHKVEMFVNRGRAEFVIMSGSVSRARAREFQPESPSSEKDKDRDRERSDVTSTTLSTSSVNPVPGEDRKNLRLVSLSPLEIKIMRKERRKIFGIPIGGNSWKTTHKSPFNESLEVNEDADDETLLRVQLDESQIVILRANSPFERALVAETIRTFNALHCLALQEVRGLHGDETDTTTEDDDDMSPTMRFDSEDAMRRQLGHGEHGNQQQHDVASVSSLQKGSKGHSMYGKGLQSSAGLHARSRADLRRQESVFRGLTKEKAAHIQEDDGTIKTTVVPGSETIVASTRQHPKAHMMGRSGRIGTHGFLGLDKFARAEDDPALASAEGWLSYEESLEDAYNEFWSEASDAVQRSVRAHLQRGKATFHNVMVCPSEASFVQPSTALSTSSYTPGGEAASQLSPGSFPGMISVLRSKLKYTVYPMKRTDDEVGISPAKDLYLQEAEDIIVPWGMGKRQNIPVPRGKDGKAAQMWDGFVALKRPITTVYFDEDYPTRMFVSVVQVKRLFRLSPTEGWVEVVRKRRMQFMVGFEFEDEYTCLVAGWTLRLMNLYHRRALEVEEGGPVLASSSISSDGQAGKGVSGDGSGLKGKKGMSFKVMSMYKSLGGHGGLRFGDEKDDDGLWDQDFLAESMAPDFSAAHSHGGSGMRQGADSDLEEMREQIMRQERSSKGGWSPDQRDDGSSRLMVDEAVQAGHSYTDSETKRKELDAELSFVSDEKGVLEESLVEIQHERKRLQKQIEEEREANIHSKGQMEREMMDMRSEMERLQKDKQKLSVIFKRRLDTSQDEIVRLKKELAQALIAVEQQKKLAAKERMLREDVERYTKSVVGKFSTLVAGDVSFLGGMGDLGSAGILGGISSPASAPSRSPPSLRGSGGSAMEMRGSQTPKTTPGPSSTLSISALSSQSQHGSIAQGPPPPSRRAPSKPQSDTDDI